MAHLHCLLGAPGPQGLGEGEGRVRGATAACCGGSAMAAALLGTEKHTSSWHQACDC